MDVYLSTVSNRLNTVMKQLTIMATVFLPLTFITGFFGQNFGWMVGHIRSPAIFFALGIGLEVVTVAALFTVFKRRGWFCRRKDEANAPCRTLRRAPRLIVDPE